MSDDDEQIEDVVTFATARPTLWIGKAVPILPPRRPVFFGLMMDNDGIREQTNPARAWCGDKGQQRQQRRSTWEKRNEQRRNATRQIRLANLNIIERLRER